MQSSIGLGLRRLPCLSSWEMQRRSLCRGGGSWWMIMIMKMGSLLHWLLMRNKMGFATRVVAAFILRKMRSVSHQDLHHTGSFLQLHVKLVIFLSFFFGAGFIDCFGYEYWIEINRFSLCCWSANFWCDWMNSHAWKRFLIIEGDYEKFCVEIFANYVFELCAKWNVLVTTRFCLWLWYAVGCVV